MKLLVTGGAGFIGSHVVDFALARGDQVIVLDNFLSGKRENLPVAHERLVIIDGDVCDVSLLSSLVVNVDAVVHLAGIVSVPKTIEDPFASLRVNTQGSLQLFQSLANHASKVPCLYASSAAVYGDSSDPCDASRPLATVPLSPYAVEKRTTELYAAYFARQYGLSLLGLRFFNVYGDRQDPYSPYSGVISRFRECFENNRPPVIYGDGEQVRDFVPVQILVEKLFGFLDLRHTGIENICTGVGTTLNQLILSLQKEYHVALTPQYLPAREGDIRLSVGVPPKA